MEQPTTPSTPTPSPAPETVPQPQTVEIVRYPFLTLMIVALRIMAFVFFVVGAFLALVHLIADEGFFVKMGNFFLWICIGFFQGIVSLTLSEGVKVWLDTEKQTRPKEVDEELRKIVSQ